MDRKIRPWDWWAHFFRVRHRAGIPGIGDFDRRLLDFLVHALDLSEGSRVLDVACGSGVHLLGLARRGIGGLGFDVSESLVNHATEAAAPFAERISFTTGDMRDIAQVIGGERFDAATLLSGSFGFFGVEDDLRVLDGMRGALKPGGRLLLDCVSHAGSARMRDRHWEAVEDGYLLTETTFDPASGFRQSGFLYVDGDGVVNSIAEPERIRIYTLPEVLGLLAAVDLAFLSAHGSHELPPVPYDAAHPDRMVVVAQRPSR